MLGTVAGDVIGSVYEVDRIKHTDFPLFSPRSRFTDDTVLTIATAHALLTGQPYADAYHEFGNRYPRAGYGGAFRDWLVRDDRTPYGSFGNGSAMRVGPVGLAMRTADELLTQAVRSAAVTHDHTEGAMAAEVLSRLPYEFREVIAEFNERFGS